MESTLSCEARIRQEMHRGAVAVRRDSGALGFRGLGVPLKGSTGVPLKRSISKDSIRDL